MNLTTFHCQIELKGKFMEKEKLIERMNASSVEERLKAAREMGELIRAGEITRRETPEVNNHVHTIYSFSPYSPTLAAFKAWQAGLLAVGIMDHDSVGGLEEMVKAGKLIGLATTCGFEMRVNFSGTAVEGRRINNPDSPNLVYMTLHGIPVSRAGECETFLKPYRTARFERNRAEVTKLNGLLSEYGLPGLDFDKDVVSISQNDKGGSITERHICFALAAKLVEIAGKGQGVVTLMEEKMGLTLKGTLRENLLDQSNPHYLYDLLGVMKGSFVDRFFIQPTEKECPPVREVTAFAQSIGAIPSYAYLGDVGESPTGDKKAQTFEDSYLDELAEVLKEVGFQAITYMPPRNTLEQLKRVMALCEKYQFMEISGVDINSSRQIFNCPEILQDDFKHLIDATWALIVHEKLGDKDPDLGLFNPRNPLASKSLKERLAAYALAGKSMDPVKPEEISI
jgi:hypothetical protein